MPEVVKNAVFDLYKRQIPQFISKRFQKVEDMKYFLELCGCDGRYLEEKEGSLVVVFHNREIPISESNINKEIVFSLNFINKPTDLIVLLEFLQREPVEPTKTKLLATEDEVSYENKQRRNNVQELQYFIYSQGGFKGFFQNLLTGNSLDLINVFSNNIQWLESKIKSFISNGKRITLDFFPREFLGAVSALNGEQQVLWLRLFDLQNLSARELLRRDNFVVLASLSKKALEIVGQILPRNLVSAREIDKDFFQVLNEVKENDNFLGGFILNCFQPQILTENVFLDDEIMAMISLWGKWSRQRLVSKLMSKSLTLKFFNLSIRQQFFQSLDLIGQKAMLKSLDLEKMSFSNVSAVKDWLKSLGCEVGILKRVDSNLQAKLIVFQNTQRVGEWQNITYSTSQGMIKFNALLTGSEEVFLGFIQQLQEKKMQKRC